MGGSLRGNETGETRLCVARVWARAPARPSMWRRSESPWIRWRSGDESTDLCHWWVPLNPTVQSLLAGRDIVTVAKLEAASGCLSAAWSL